MHVIHSSAWYFPDSSGGVEVYVDGLVQALRSRGIESTIAVPAETERIESHRGIPVFRYPTIAAFKTWLTQNRTDIYHQHTIRDRCGLEHLAIARDLGMKTITTVHMPEIVCLRGTMMNTNHQACDGRIDIARCSQCLGVSPRIPSSIANTIAQLPLKTMKAGRDRLRRSSDVRVRQLGTTIYTPPLVRHHDRQLREMVRLSDRMVVVCQWLFDALVANGVPREKLLLSRQGVSIGQSHRTPANDRLQIGFLGRWQETKGVQVLVEALQQIPRAVPIDLIIHATHADQHGRANQEKILAIAATDSRIHIKPALDRHEVAQAIAQFDLLAVPSQWLETGPLVVLEAQAAGTPILGSNLGGIAELVTHDRDGWLIPARDRSAWATAMQQMAEQPEILTRLRSGIRSVRTHEDVAIDMQMLYELLKAKRAL